MNLLLPPGLVTGTPVAASAVPLGVSPELASHHLSVHGCPKTGHWIKDSYYCEHDGATAEVIGCEVCGDPVAVIIPVLCEHASELLADLNSEVTC